MRMQDRYLFKAKSFDYEVVGNKFDNPELL